MLGCKLQKKTALYFCHDEDDGTVTQRLCHVLSAACVLCSRLVYKAYENMPNSAKKRK